MPSVTFSISLMKPWNCVSMICWSRTREISNHSVTWMQKRTIVHWVSGVQLHRHQGFVSWSLTQNQQAQFREAAVGRRSRNLTSVPITFVSQKRQLGAGWSWRSLGTLFFTMWSWDAAYLSHSLLSDLFLSLMKHSLFPSQNLILNFQPNRICLEYVVFVFFFLFVLGIALISLHLPERWCSTELYPWPGWCIE